MNLESIADYLEAEGYGTIGVDIFAYRMPEGATEGVLFTLPLVGVMIDHNMPGYYKSNFMMVVRAARIDTGIARAEALSDALTLYDTTLTNVRVNHIRPRFEPVVFPSSQGDNFEVSVGFDASYYNC